MALNRQTAIAAAEKLVAKGKIEAAIKEYRKLLAENPNDASTLNRLGDLFVRLTRIDEAVRLFTQIADRYTEDGFFVKAIAIYKKIIKLDPTRLAVYERLAELYHKQGLVTEARTQYQVLVDYYQKHANPNAAVNVLQRMAELEPEDPSPHVKLADLFRQLGQHDKELAEYRTIADLMVRHGRIDEATQVFMKAVAAAPNDIAFITDAVLGLKDGGHVAAAARLLAVAVERNPQAEKIARLAGLGRKDRPGVVEIPEPGPRTITVNELIAEPPGRAPLPPPAPPPEPEPAREVLFVDEELIEGHPPGGEPLRPLEIGPLDDGFVIDLPEEGLPASSQVEPTEAMLRRSPESPWFEHTSAEFEIEIEGLEAVEASDPVGSVESAAAAPSGAPTPLVGGEFGLPPAAEEAIEWDFEPQPELELELELPETVTSPPAAVPEPPGRPGAERRPLDLAELEKTSFEVVPEEVPVARRLDDLLAEAEVFAKYGLREKSHDRVREILHANPRHVGAFSLQLTLWLEEGRHDRVVARAAQLHQLATETGQAETWGHLRAKLAKAGYRFEDDRLVAGPVAKREKKDSVSALLEELVGPGEPAKPSKRKATVDPLAALTAELGQTTRAARPARVPPVRPPVEPTLPAARAEAGPASVEPPAKPVPPPATKPPAPDESLAWLDRAPTPRGGASSADEALFEDEEGFFDLAAELEQELSLEELASSRGTAASQEQSLEEIVEGFKKGVAESLSAEDYDTHFNLGIAYREMGLLDEAIGEFQLAAKDPKFLIDCCSLLGASFLDKGLPDLAVRWYQRGLEVPDLPEEATLGLLYDLGNLYQLVGEVEKARKTFVEIYGINSNYRDVVARLEELGG